MSLLLMCECPVRRGRVDELFEREHAAALDAGLEVSLIDHDLLLAGTLERALRRVDRAPGGRIAAG